MEINLYSQCNKLEIRQNWNHRTESDEWLLKTMWIWTANLYFHEDKQRTIAILLLAIYTSNKVGHIWFYTRSFRLLWTFGYIFHNDNLFSIKTAFKSFDRTCLHHFFRLFNSDCRLKDAIDLTFMCGYCTILFKKDADTTLIIAHSLAVLEFPKVMTSYFGIWKQIAVRWAIEGECARFHGSRW